MIKHFKRLQRPLLLFTFFAVLGMGDRVRSVSGTTDIDKSLQTKASSGEWVGAVSDYSRVATNYSSYRQQYPDRFFDFIGELIAKRAHSTGNKKVKIVDLGTGTGFVSLAIAKRFGEQVEVTGVDRAAGMIDAAIAANKREGLQVSFQQAPAEHTGFLANTFDIVIAARSWHWFDQKKAMIEVKRILKPNGFFVIAVFGMFDGPVMHVTNDLILTYNPNWHLFRKIRSAILAYIRQLHRHGFAGVHGSMVVDRKQLTQDYWVNYINTTSALAANPEIDKATVARFNSAHKQLLAEKFGHQKLLDVDFQYYVVSGQWKDSLGQSKL
jgi:ubiquinone/menaquinone biosynthesis C-methylase UbiE